MGYRIGVASSDGIVVNRHFGRADSFLIIEVNDNGQYSLVDRRYISPVCEGGSHDDGRLNEAVEQLKDCRYILVSRIGQGAECALEQRKITAFELPGMIDESLKKAVEYIKIQNLIM